MTSFRYRTLTHPAAKADIASAQAFALAALSSGSLRANPVGPGRYYMLSPEAPGVERWQTEIRARLPILSSGVADHLIGASLLSVVLRGGEVTPHVDADLRAAGRTHVRIVVGLQIADRSHWPILDDTAVPVSTGDAWVIAASEIRHGTKPNAVDAPRIVHQTGFWVATAELDVLEAQLDDWRASLDRELSV